MACEKIRRRLENTSFSSMSQFASIVSILHNLDLIGVRMFNFKVSRCPKVQPKRKRLLVRDKGQFVSRCYDSDFKRRGKPQLVFMNHRIIMVSSWERNLI